VLEKNKIYCGKAEELLGEIDTNSVDLIVTDPPYGLSFMGKDWDKAIPKLEIWQDCYRVLKNGAFAFIMSSPRQDVLSRMMIRLEDAGFLINFTSLYWTYASGFPKAENISKMIDKRMGAEREVVGKNPNWRPSQEHYSWGDGQPTPQIVDKNITIPSTPESKALDGSYGGFQPKPAVEVIIVAMKPLSEKTFVEQALKNRKGITWLDDGRIPYESEEDKESATPQGTVSYTSESWGQQVGLKKDNQEHREANPQGRFPANLLVSDDVLNDGEITNNWRPSKIIPKTHLESEFLFELQENAIKKGLQRNRYSDSGSFSRYFDLDAWFLENIKKLPKEIQKTFPFLIVPKAGKSEKNKGLEKCEEKMDCDRNPDCYSADVAFNRSSNPKKNIHPTVKPLKLFHYLITLGSREEDIVLDPFIGSGTIALACQQLNRNFIGIEINPEYVEIANKRLSQRNISSY